MIIGDSFSAFKEGYSRVLHDSLPDYNIRNVSVSGTSIREQFLFGRHYLKKAKPDVLIFQFYVGNDLFGWEHTLNWNEISMTRNAYWWLTEKIWSLAYLNYSMRGFKASMNEIDTTGRQEWMNTPFSVENYSNREKLYFKSEPKLIENSLYLDGGRAQDMNQYLRRVARLFEYVPENSEIFFLVIPHMSQVHSKYKSHSEQLGSVFSPKFSVASESYPLYTLIREYFATDKRVKIIDPLALLNRFEQEGRSVFFENDSHLNSFGQQVIGNYLLEKIRQND